MRLTVSVARSRSSRAGASRTIAMRSMSDFLVQSAREREPNRMTHSASMRSRAFWATDTARGSCPAFALSDIMMGWAAVMSALPLGWGLSCAGRSQSASQSVRALSSISKPSPGRSDSVMVPPTGIIGSTKSSATRSAGPVNSSENSCGRMAFPTVL